RTDVDGPPGGWDTARGCVPRDDVGRGAGTNLQVRIGAAPVLRTAVSASSLDLGVAASWSGTLVSWLSRLEPRTKIITAPQMGTSVYASRATSYGGLSTARHSMPGRRSDEAPTARQ